jgi:hypothetical protein
MIGEKAMGDFNKWRVKLDKLKKSLASTDGSSYDLRVRWDNNEPYRWKDPVTGEERSGSEKDFLDAGGILVEWGEDEE